jgi:hypothetical protein
MVLSGGLLGGLLGIMEEQKPVTWVGGGARGRKLVKDIATWPSMGI